MTITDEMGEKPVKRKHHFLQGCLISILVIFGLIVLVWLAGAGLIVSEPLKQVDAIIVLSGGKTDRLAEGVKLFNEGYSSWLILTQTTDDPLDPETQVDNVKFMSAVHMGVPADNVRVTRVAAGSTVGEAEAVLHEMEYYGYKNCIVVTDSFHTLRTRVIFGSVFRGKGISFIIHAAPVDWYRRSNWWTTPEGWTTATSEWIKLIGFLVGIRQN